MKTRAFFLFAVVVLVSDQLTKFWVRTYLPLGYSLPAEGFIRLTHVGNKGAVFGLFPGQGYLFLISTLLLLGLLLFFFWQPQLRRHGWSLGLVFGGGLGNLIDRLRQGYVTDFIDLQVWPVFNVADAAIVIGAGLIIFLVLKGEGR